MTNDVAQPDMMIKDQKNDFIMHDNDDMLFDTPTIRGGDGNDVKISIIELKARERNSPGYDLERTQIAIKSLNAGTWTLDILTHSLVLCNRCVEIIPIGQLDNINIKSLCDLIIAGYKKRVVDCFLQGIQRQGSFDMEVPVLATKGSHSKWLRIAGAIAFNEGSSTSKVHGIVEDISERKNSELLKQDFLTMASHDLRSPLSAIKLYVQLCGRVAAGAGDDYVSAMLEKANGYVDKMNAMIQCYLESSAISEGVLSLFPLPFDIKELLCEVIGELYLLNPGHIIFLKPGRCISICADREKIAQVLQNLLSNAIKYSSCTDVITVHFGKVGNCLQVAVEDHGIGIKPADQGKVFDRFYRVEREKEEAIRGYGIGLYLSKEIIKKHKGDIWLESEVNKGSKFYFTLPLC